MKKHFQRWYQKNEHLNAFMSLFKDLEIETQCNIAVDIIVRAADMTDRDYSKMIQEVAEYDPREFKRWYDKNPNLHLAIESLRDLDEEQRDEIIQEFTDTILSKHKTEIKGIE